VSTLLQPFRHSLADLVLAYELTAIRLLKASFDFVQQVQTIQGVFDPGVIGEVVNRL